MAAGCNRMFAAVLGFSPGGIAASANPGEFHLQRRGTKSVLPNVVVPAYAQHRLRLKQQLNPRQRPA
jgi:hypothetical protein